MSPLSSKMCRLKTNHTPSLLHRRSPFSRHTLMMKIVHSERQRWWPRLKGCEVGSHILWKCSDCTPVDSEREEATGVVSGGRKSKASKNKRHILFFKCSLAPQSYERPEALWNGTTLQDPRTSSRVGNQSAEHLCRNHRWVQTETFLSTVFLLCLVLGTENTWLGSEKHRGLV